MTDDVDRARGLKAWLSARRAERRATRAERAQKRNEANALRLGNQRGENNKGRFSGGAGG
jgi:hypothetical protein